jgi:predicted MFS family arabinose efflux permease
LFYDYDSHASFSACLVTVLVAMHADKKRERGFHIAIPAAVGAIGYLLLFLLRNKGPVAMYIAACITVTGVFSHIPAMLSWFGNNIGGHTKRGVASAIIISIGNVGGAIGGQIYRANDAPLYGRPNLIAMGLMWGAVVFSLLFKWSLRRENRRRDNLSKEEYDHEASKPDICDRHPGFRYMS